MRSAVARMTSTPSADSDASTSSVLRPSRSRRAATWTAAIGTGRMISKVTPAVWRSARSPSRSTARPSSAAGGPACWARGSHGPLVSSVARNRPSPCGR
jgi:hypothetical protein